MIVIVRVYYLTHKHVLIAKYNGFKTKMSKTNNELNPFVKLRR